VWHLGDGDSTASDYYKDSTSNNNDGTLTDIDGDVESISSQIYKGLDFQGDNDRINVGNGSSLNLGATFTLSGWVNVTSHNNPGYQFLISKDAVGGDSYDLGFKNGAP